jgi:SAM-dependent methyltransferase
MVHPQFSMSLKDIFTDIYEKQSWHDAFSGPGSRLDSTEKYREFVSRIIIEHQIVRILDVGCGYWTFAQHIDWGDTEYLGIDIVEKVIEYNQQFSTPTRQFKVATIDEVHVETYDLIILKDVLQHLSMKEIKKILRTASAAKYLLITNDNCCGNLECKDGEWRPLNMRVYPFHFQPIEWFIYQSAPFDKACYFIKADLAKTL